MVTPPRWLGSQARTTGRACRGAHVGARPGEGPTQCPTHQERNASAAPAGPPEGAPAPRKAMAAGGRAAVADAVRILVHAELHGPRTDGAGPGVRLWPPTSPRARWRDVLSVRSEEGRPGE